MFVSIATMIAPATAAESVRRWTAIPARPTVVRGADRRLLDRAEQFAADEQWEDALAAITRLLAADSSSPVVRIEDDHFVTLSEYCHRLLARFPAETLLRYRQLVDASSESSYQQAVVERDEQVLQRIVDENFCSSWGDDALLALGELALERGDYQAARHAWLRISSELGEIANRLTYPDTRLSLPAVEARLVLVSLREGDWQRANRELEGLRESDPVATGRLGGREVVLVDRLRDLLKQARQWPPLPTSTDWPTFAASPQRTGARPGSNPQGPYEYLWSQPLNNKGLATFPIVAGGLVVCQDATTVRAWNLADGDPVFTAQGSAFQSPDLPTDWFGQPRYTLNASGHRVFGVITSALGPRRTSSSAEELSACWCIDLQREGALAFRLASDDPGVAFVGSPLVIENRLFVACRGNDHTARAGIACYDLDTHERLWQRWLCQANTPATGWTNEIATNLLTYDAGVIYANTNLGAIAAVRADDGRVLWLRTYERQTAELGSAGDCAYYRGPSPCIYYRGTVFVLPTDSRAVVALDAGTGTEIWRYPVDDPQAQLIGVTDQRVVLSDRGIRVLACKTGELTGKEADAQLMGQAALGNRTLAWPQNSGIHFFSIADADLVDRGGSIPEPGGANLALAGEYFIAAGPSRLSVFRYPPRPTDRPSGPPTSSKE